MSQNDLNQLAMLFSPEEIKQMIASRNATVSKLPIENKTIVNKKNKVAKKTVVVKGRKPIVKVKKVKLEDMEKTLLKYMEEEDKQAIRYGNVSDKYAKIIRQVKKVNPELMQKKKPTLYSATILIYSRDEPEEKSKSIIHDTRTPPRTYYFIRRMIVGVTQARIQEFNQRRTFDYEREKWDNLTTILEDDNFFADFYSERSHYVNAIIVKEVNTIKASTSYDLLTTPLHESSINKAIHNKYINYKTNAKATDFASLFKTEKGLNERANSCYINAILNTFQEAFNKKKPDGKRKFKELTYDSVMVMLNMDYKYDNIGLSINKSLPFFERFRIGLDVLDPFHNIVFQYRPDKLNDQINPQVLRIVVNNNHCFQLNENVKSFAHSKHKVIQDDSDFQDQLRINNKYNIDEREIIEENIHFIKTLDDVVKIVLDCDSEKMTYLRFIYNDDLTDLLFEMMDQGYSPSVNYQSGSLLSISFKLENVVGTIALSDITCPNNIQIAIDNKQQYVDYQISDKKFYSAIIQEKHKSTYHPSVIELEKEYPKGPIVAPFVDNIDPERSFNGVDMRKSYTDCLTKIEKIPVFGYFDVYEKYDGHAIEDYNMYIVHHVAKTIKDTILFPQTYHRCFGYKLNRCDTEVTVMYFMRPSKLVDVDFKDDVDKLFKSEKIPMSLRKFISNKTTGLLEKKNNKKSLTKVFGKVDEMLYYQMKYGGSYRILKHEKRNNKVYLLTFNKQVDLIDGFKHIKDLIYDLQTMKLIDLYDKLVANNIKPYGCNTDSIFIKENFDQVKHLFDFSDNIGCFKFETDKNIKCQRDADGKKIQQNETNVPKVKIHEVKVIEIKDEFDDKEMLKVLNENNHVLCLGTLPGVGKTSAIKLLAKHGKKVLFVTPFNKLCQEHRKDGVDAITFHKLTNTYIDDKTKKCGHAHDVSGVDALCNDEVLLSSPMELMKLAQFMQGHPEQKFYATGDASQLAPFSTGLNNIVDIREYQQRCLNMLFPTQFTLKVNKRMKKESDRIKLNHLKADIFNPKKNVMQTLKDFGLKIIHKMDDVKTTTNICYFNYRAKVVSKHIQKMMLNKKPIGNAIKIGDLWYYKGMNLICCKHFQSKKTRVHVNYEYTVTSINEKEFTIQDVVDGDKVTMPIQMIDQNFKLPYGLTCHSVQGLSIDDKMTIFDVNCAYTSREYVWTAITRARSLDNIQIFNHPKNEVKALYEAKIKQYLSLKVNGYKEQDKSKKREWVESEYVTSKWIQDNFNECKTCEGCKQDMELYMDSNNNVHSNLTVDRIDSSISHVISNCRLLCYKCNCKTGKDKTKHYTPFKEVNTNGQNNKEKDYGIEIIVIEKKKNDDK